MTFSTIFVILCNKSLEVIGEIDQMVSIQGTNTVMYRYAEAYEKLYNRRPRDLRALDDNWVIVNGARMRLTELDHLTKQLQMEYKQSLSNRRNMVSKLIKWFKG